jgi:hypothetical protein
MKGVKLSNVATLDSKADSVAVGLALAGVSSISSKSNKYKFDCELGGTDADAAGVLAVVRSTCGRVVTVVRVLPKSEVVVPFEYTAEWKWPATNDIVIADRA